MEQIQKRKVTTSVGAKLTPDAPKTEDRVVADIKGATQFLKSLPQKIRDVVANQQSGDQSTKNTSPINFNSKIVKVLFATVAIFVTLLIVGKIFQAIKNKDGNNSQNPAAIEEGIPTPTPRYEISITPKLGESVYANDPLILEVEKELDILRNEISTTSLRESLLIPPALDFNISF